MAETNKSKLMSEAEIIEAINSDSLVSVSLGAGQPQKNVKMSTLASVVAGLMDCVKCISTSKTNASSVSIDVSILFKQNEGAPKKWELFLGQWGQSAIAHAIGICRFYFGDGSLNNAIITSSNSVTATAKMDASGILTISTSVSFSYVKLCVYH